MKKEFKRPYEMKWIVVSKLKSSQRYQRGIRNKQVSEIVNDFNDLLITPIRVSLRDGSYYVWDGQHTFASIRAVYGDSVSVPCLVYDNLSYEKEAELLSILDKHNRKLSMNDRLNAMNEALEKDVLEFKKAIVDCGYNIEFNTYNSKRDYYIQCNDYMYKNVYKKHGAEYMKNMLLILSNAFDGFYESNRAHIVKGLNCFMETFDGEYREETLVKALRKTTPATLKLNASTDRIHKNLSQKMAFQMFDLYNRTTSNKLTDKLKNPSM